MNFYFSIFSTSPFLTRIFQKDSSSTSKNDEDIGEEIQQLIEQHNRKILSQKSEYDLNGRKIRKTASPQKPGKVCMLCFIFPIFSIHLSRNRKEVRRPKNAYFFSISEKSVGE